MSEYSAYVVVATSLAAGITSWNAHDDLSRRVSRYTNAVRSIERLLWWWQSLDDIERASASNIALLVESGEAIISAERLAWITAFKRRRRPRAARAARRPPPSRCSSGRAGWGWSPWRIVAQAELTHAGSNSACRSIPH